MYTVCSSGIVLKHAVFYRTCNVRLHGILCQALYTPLYQVKRKDKLSALKALLHTPIEEEAKQRHAEVTTHQFQQTLGRARRSKRK